MKKYSLNLMKCAVGLTILLGLLLILFSNEKSFEKIVSDDIENITKLSSSTIYAEIDNSLTKPIFVGQTMANDLFLKNWLAAELPNGGDRAQTDEIQRYLSGYREKYQYDSVFLVSANSGIYYYYEGINKVVNPADDHDIWYYDFVESGLPYDLDVDVDEANNNELTVFVNCRMEARDGTLLGVVGVGVKMVHLQALLGKYEHEYTLRAFLMNGDGLIQVDSVDANIERVHFFDTPGLAAKREQIVGNKTSMELCWYPEDGLDHCLITQYVDNLDWYIVIEKDTAETQQMLKSQIDRDLVLVSMIIVLVLLMISYIIGRYNRLLLKTANMDDVTNLPNSKMFQEIFRKNSRRPGCRKGVMFLFDIDHFKDINDRFGHLFGNTMLYQVSARAKEILGNAGVVARWGGDEFVGVIYGPRGEAEALLNKIVENISKLQEGEACPITVSLGATVLAPGNNLEKLLWQADSAMYRAKKNGRNQITFF